MSERPNAADQLLENLREARELAWDFRKRLRAIDDEQGWEDGSALVNLLDAVETNANEVFRQPTLEDSVRLAGKLSDTICSSLTEKIAEEEAALDRFLDD